MNHIFELLIDNIGAVIVIAVAAVSLLGKMKINIGNPSGPPMRPMPSFGGGPGETEVPVPNVAPRVAWESLEGVTLEGESRTRVMDVPKQTPSIHTFHAGTPSAQGDVLLDSTPGKEDLRRAVLWAEILGPPRSKKPHGRS